VAAIHGGLQDFRVKSSKSVAAIIAGRGSRVRTGRGCGVHIVLRAVYDAAHSQWSQA